MEYFAHDKRVKLVLRGSAEIHHVSFVRQVPGEPTVVHTQFGLYIPRDGFQRVRWSYPEITALQPRLSSLEAVGSFTQPSAQLLAANPGLNNWRHISALPMPLPRHSGTKKPKCP